MEGSGIVIKKKIKEGTPCHISTVGHNGFWYPIHAESALTKVARDIGDPTLKTWVCGTTNLVAVEVTVEDIKDLYGDPSQKTIVWVEKKFIINER